ncbi:hypothetical protein [Nocardia terpenica]|uniref:Uncharacterized protein n=1 Tax=Nocardia terpenica TaxID=455432 RepID=A0A164PHG3_9NOCA|nr:hypothetical protein [Nocardia terpenica]KZM75576.1 hypothetical protein AWN90_19575 [Nocardia terpenica]NQE86059.1 hypothetical protein [Nocardia terpenica]
MAITYTVTKSSPGIPDIHRLGLACIQVFETQPEYGDRTDMYVFQFAGVCVHIRQRCSDTFVHVEDDDIPATALPLVVSVNNGPDTHYGDSGS